MPRIATPRRSSMSTSGGFTLLELMITVAVLVVLVTLAAPSFTGMMARNRSAALSNALNGSLQLARSEAVKRGIPVSLCASAAPQADKPVCADGAWASGWLIFVEALGEAGNKRGVFEENKKDRLLRVHQPETSATITPATAFANYLTFYPDGTVLGKQRGDTTGGVTVAVDNVPADRWPTLCLGNTGNIRLTKGGNDKCEK